MLFSPDRGFVEAPFLFLEKSDYREQEKAPKKKIKVPGLIL